MSEKDWYKFCVNAENSVPDYFEKELCREFFAIQNGIKIEDIKNPPNYPGIENIPVNGIAYQSKYTLDWEQYKKSLDTIYEKHWSEYSDLVKVLFYVWSCSPKESSERLNPDGIFTKLTSIWVSVEFIDRDGMFNIIKQYPQYQNLRRYFKIPADKKRLLEISEKYINELYLDDARLILEVVFSDFDALDSSQKFTYFKLLWNLKCYDPEDNSNYENDYLEACKHENGTNRSIIVESVAMIQKWILDWIEEKLLKIGGESFEPSAERALLMLYNSQKLSFDDILNKITPKYKEDPIILKALWRIAFEKKDYPTAVEYFEKWFSMSDSFFIDTIAYFEILVAYSQEVCSFDEFNLEWKKIYEKLFIVYESFKDSLSWRSLDKKQLAHIYNFLWVAKSRVFNDIEAGICFVKQWLEIFYDPIIYFNLWKIYQDKNDSSKAKEIYRKLFIDFSSQPSSDLVIQQVPILLSQIYIDEWNLETAISTLQDYSEKYNDIILPEIKKNLILTLAQAIDSSWSKEKAIEIIDSAITVEPQNFVFFLVKHRISWDTKFLAEAYDIAILMESSHEHPVYEFLQLAWRLRAFSFHEKSFNLYKKHFRNLEDRKHFEGFLGLSILKNDYWLASSIVDQYKSLFWIDDFYIYSKAVIYKNQWEHTLAISLIENFDWYISDLKLLFELLHLYFETSNVESIKDTLVRIEKDPQFKDLNLEYTCEYIKFYHTFVDKVQAIKKLYTYIQRDPTSTEFKELYFTILLSDKDIGTIDISEISSETIVTVKEVWSENLTKISLDWYSTIWVDSISKEWELIYGKLIWKKHGNIVSDIFKDNPLFSKSYEITSIENKYIRTYQEVMGHMLHAWKMEAIPVSDWNDMQEFMSVLDKIDSSTHNRNIGLDEIYQKGMLLVSSLSEFTSNTIYFTYKAITLGDKWNIISDTLVKFQSKEDLPKKITLDTTSILTLSELKILEIASDSSEVLISKSVFDYFTDEITHIQQELDRTSSTLVTQEDWTRVMYENTLDLKISSIEELTAIKGWIKDKCTIVANPIFDIEKDSEIKKLLWEEFYDSLFSAKNSNSVLVSDDLALRKIWRWDEVGVICLSTESLLWVLYNRWVLDVKGYCSGLRNLMKLNFINLSFNTGVILNSLLNEDTEISAKELATIYGYCKKFEVDIGFILLSIFETISNLLRHYETARNKFVLIFDAIIQFYDFDQIKALYISELDKSEASEVTNRLYKLITDYEATKQWASSR